MQLARLDVRLAPFKAERTIPRHVQGAFRISHYPMPILRPAWRRLALARTVNILTRDQARVKREESGPNFEFWLRNNRCSPACTTCTGPATDQCLACASPRSNMAGSCVGYDGSTGVCDTSLSDLQGVFVVNNAKSECDGMFGWWLSAPSSSFSSLPGWLPHLHDSIFLFRIGLLEPPVSELS